MEKNPQQLLTVSELTRFFGGTIIPPWVPYLQRCKPHALARVKDTIEERARQIKIPDRVIFAASNYSITPALTSDQAMCYGCGKIREEVLATHSICGTSEPFLLDIDYAYETHRWKPLNQRDIDDVFPWPQPRHWYKYICDLPLPALQEVAGVYARMLESGVEY